MTSFAIDQPVDISPFTRQIENGEAVIGRPETGVFLALPVEALELLDSLAAGQTVAEARDAFASRHGETPDMGDLLEHLAAHGLARPAGSADGETTVFRDQFGWIPLPLARAFFSPPAFFLYGAIVVAGLLAVFDSPELLPGWRAAYFPRDTALMLFALMVLGLATTFFHELGHVLAARAQGVATRFAISNRLWFVVWETDMTGVWALPRRRRYLPILAGPLVDLLSASLLVLVGWAAGHGWLDASPMAQQIMRALLLIYLMRLVWQAYFFVRTDYYYAMTNALGCKSLMADTVAYLRELWSRLRGRAKSGSLDHLPVREQRAVRGYAVVWLAGRGVALSVLIFIQLPLFFNYLRLLVTRASTGGGSQAGVTTWLPVVMFLLFFAAGMAMWIRGLLRRGRQDPTLARANGADRRQPAGRSAKTSPLLEPET